MKDQRAPQFSLGDIADLLRGRLIYLATVRMDGTQSKATPLWYTVTPEHIILIQSGPGSWHTRRIRRGSPVIFWIGSRRGPGFIGTAELSHDPVVVAQIINDYPRKYLMARLGLHRPSMSSFERGDRVAIKLISLQALPPDFRPQPGAPAPTLGDVAGNRR